MSDRDVVCALIGLFLGAVCGAVFIGWFGLDGIIHMIEMNQEGGH